MGFWGGCRETPALLSQPGFPPAGLEASYSPPFPHPHPSASPLDCSSKTGLRLAPLHAIVQSRPSHLRLSPCLIPLQLGLPLHACSLGALPASDTSARGSFQNRNPIPQPETVQRLLMAHRTHLHPSSWPGSHAESSHSLIVRLRKVPQRPRGFFPLLPQRPSCSHRSHLGSGHWPVSHPHLSVYLVTGPLPGHSSLLKVWGEGI